MRGTGGTLSVSGGFLLHGVGDVGAVEDVVVVVEVEHGEVVRAGGEVEVLVDAGAVVAAKFVAVVPDLHLADGNRFIRTSYDMHGGHVEGFPRCG